MRVNVQLVETDTGAHVWAERFDKPVADFFDMQDEIVSSLANRLGQELATGAASGARGEPQLDGSLFSRARPIQQGRNRRNL